MEKISKFNIGEVELIMHVWFYYGCKGGEKPFKTIPKSHVKNHVMLLKR
jgi:hypothetical protein